MSLLKTYKITPISKISIKDRTCLELAKDTSYNSITFSKSRRMGSVILIKGKIYITGYNKHLVKKSKNHNTHSIHAEVDAINNCNLIKKLSSSTLFVTRILLHDKRAKIYGKEYLYGCSKPCINCQKTILAYGIKKVKYTDIINDVNVLVTAHFK